MAQAGRIKTRQMRTGRRALAAALLMAVGSLALAATGTADPGGKYSKFANCPYKDPEVSKCFYSETIGGEVTLGSTKVPIVNPAVLQGAYTEPDKRSVSKFIGATKGPTLSKASQPVPGGLVGIVAPQDAPDLVKAVVALLFENDLTKVSATLELAKPASAIRLNEESLGGELGTALTLPIKVHLENPLLGPSCYVGSSSAPVVWNLSSGATTPPKPHKPIQGSVGEIEFLEEGRVIELKDTTLVDNAWKMPAASGCGGPLSFLINPIVNKAAALPSAAGASTAILKNEASISSAIAVEQHAE
jgi:hypothetical protein